jgi:hypothetical protein
MPAFLLFFGFAFPGGPFSAAAQECFSLVHKLDAPRFKDRSKAQRELQQRPSAIWAVHWGSRHSTGLEISRRCTAILAEWRLRSEDGGLGDLVSKTDGSFDRFLNSFLISQEDDFELFKRFSAVVRTFDKFLVRNSYSSLTRNNDRPITPFHPYERYIKQYDPGLVERRFAADLRWPTPGLRRVERLEREVVINSMVLCQGSAHIQRCLRSAVIAGGDFRCDEVASLSMVFAAGDVWIGGPRESSTLVLVVAGGDVHVAGKSSSSLLIVTCGEATVESQRTSKLPSSLRLLTFHGKPKPAGDLFTFSSLTDWGLEATAEGQQVRIGKMSAESPLKRTLRENDVVVSCQGKKINSIGQFRRLLSLAAETDELICVVERFGKSLVVRQKIK